MPPRSLMKKPEGMVPRGRTIRLYPTLEQKQWMRLVQDESRHAWNHLVAQYNAKVKERYEIAERDGVLGEKPQRPASDAGHEPWKAYYAELGKRRKLAAEHSPDVRMAIPKTDAAAYKALWAEWEKTGKPRRMTANLYQALLQDFGRAMIPKKGNVRWRPPRFRKDSDPMPIRTGTGINVKPSGDRHRNALVQLPGLGWILGIAHRDLELMKKGTMVEGVAFTEHTDGWYAAVRIWVPEEQPRRLIDDTVHVEIGMDTLCTAKVFDELNLSMHVLKVWQNPRTAVVDVALPKEGRLPLVKRFPRGRHFERGARIDNKWREAPERAMTRRARHVGDLIDQICKFLSAYREVALSRERCSTESLPKNERGCPYALAPGRLWTAIKNRLGDRIRWIDEEKAA